MVEQDHISTPNINTNSTDKLLFNVDNVSNNYPESNNNRNLNELGNIDDYITNESNLLAEKNQYLSEAVATNNDHLLSDFSKKSSNGSSTLDQDKNYISQIPESLIDNILDVKTSHQNNENNNFDLGSVTHGMTDNNSNINGNLELQNKNIINTENSLDKQYSNLSISRNQVRDL